VDGTEFAAARRLQLANPNLISQAHGVRCNDPSIPSDSPIVFGLSGVASGNGAKMFGQPLRDPGSKKRLAVEGPALRSKRFL
jgi:hypothetical protein